MKIYNLSNMTKGWFIGNFEPTLLKTNAVEVAVKEYKAGYAESAHYHKIATEITVVISGIVEMNGQRFEKGDIIVLEPGEVSAFRSVTDSINTVVKMPGANDDKYEVAAGLNEIVNNATER